MKLLDVYKVFEDGRHNAFTDLIFWKDRFYLTFRNAEGHLSMDGRIFVLSSKDLKEWKKVVKFSQDADLRDPKFLSTEDKLFLYTPARPKGVFFSFTEDGVRWNLLRILMKEGVGFWRPKTKDGIHFVSIYSPSAFGDWSRWCSMLFSSKDGVKWEQVSLIYKGDGANETEIDWCNDTLFAFVRREAPPHHMAVCKASPPYREWSRTDSGLLLHAPVAKRVGNKIYIVVRFKEEENYRTGVFEFAKEKLSHRISLPSGADTSYAGVVLVKGDMFISYYSSHQSLGRGSNIYLAQINLKEETIL